MNKPEEKISKEKIENQSGKESNYFTSLDYSKLSFGLEALLKNGVHFGHQKSRKDPRMEEYIYITRKKINIIDLQKTSDKLKEALDFIKNIVAGKKQILFVNTKTQFRDLVKDAATACGMPYVSERWLGGTFTNFKVIKGRVKHLKDSQDLWEKGEFKKYTKFEQMKKKEEIEKLEKKMGGIKNMDELPAAIFAMDIKEDQLAIKEAKIKGIPVIALADTNTNPNLVDYPIPANDDAISSARIILSYVCKTILENKNEEIKK